MCCCVIFVYTPSINTKCIGISGSFSGRSLWLAAHDRLAPPYIKSKKPRRTVSRPLRYVHTISNSIQRGSGRTRTPTWTQPFTHMLYSLRFFGIFYGQRVIFTADFLQRIEGYVGFLSCHDWKTIKPVRVAYFASGFASLLHEHQMVLYSVS